MRCVASPRPELIRAVSLYLTALRLEVSVCAIEQCVTGGLAVLSGSSVRLQRSPTGRKLGQPGTAVCRKLHEHLRPG